MLCAGRGNRLRPVTDGAPKALVPFLNLPLLCYNWFLLEELGVSRFFLNSAFFTQALREFAASIQKPDQAVHISHEKEGPEGAAGGLRRLKPLLPLEQAFFYLNGDSLIFPSPERLLAFKTEGLRRSRRSADPLKGLFYAVPYQKRTNGPGGFISGRNGGPGGVGGRVLWADEGHIVRAVAAPDFEPAFKGALSGESTCSERPDSFEPVRRDSVRRDSVRRDAVRRDAVRRDSVRRGAGPDRARPREEAARRQLKRGGLRPFRFSGLAVFHRDIFIKNSKPGGFHLFEDVLQDWIRQGRLEVFPDENGTIYEADAPSSFLSATESALKAFLQRRGLQTRRGRRERRRALSKSV